MPKKEIITEIEGHKLKLTNLEKVLFPSANITKAELIRYFINIAPYILKYLIDRPLTLIRYPDGISGNRFYSKNKPNWTPKWINSIQIEKEDDNTYVMSNDTASLAWMANLAALELHPMRIKSTHVANADHFIFDLDPPPSADFEVVKNLASKLKPFLEDHGYKPFLKTSGSKGLHIYVPINPIYDHKTLIESVKELAKKYIATDKITTLKLNKEARKGRVLLDIYRNHKSQTCVAPYSTRGKEGAPVSMPILWEELDTITTSQTFKINTVFEKLNERGDAWQHFYDHAVNLHSDKKTTSVNVSAELKSYDQKRDFSATSEPPAEIVKPTGKSRYIIQLHDASNLHYDLRLEDGGVLRSWAIPKGLPTAKGQKRLAIETEPHPLKYLTFEGTIPKGEYGGGEMWVFDTGEYAYLSKEEKKIKIKLKKGKIKASYQLINIKESQWLVDIIDGEDQSLNIETKPMLASLGEKIPSANKYSFEIKWDGIRVVVVKTGKEVKLISRNGNELTTKFPQIVNAMSEQEPEHIIADGEIVALEKDGVPNFSKVVGRMHLTGKDAIERAARKNKTAFYLFDCLYLDGRDIRREPLERRRAWLKVNIKPNTYIRYSESFEDGKSLFEAIEAKGMEGIMCKKKGSIYESDRRSTAWLKVKVSNTDTAIIIGYTTGKGDRSSLFGSLHLAKKVNGKYKYYGKVGTGFSHDKMKDIFEKISAIKPTRKPIHDSIEEEHNTIWIEPIYQCKIKYASMTSNDTYREPVFISIQKAKNA